MKWMEIRVRFEAPQPAIAEELIADAFHTLGLQGVIIEDPRADPDLDWAPDTLPRPAHHAVIGYLAENEQYTPRLDRLQVALDGLAARESMALKLSWRSMDEEEWAHSWKAHFKPLRVGQRMVVKPTWESWKADPDDLIIEIDPGMAFGTGTHPTSALCLELLETHLKPGDDLLDIGTGSGILLVGAAKLGARRLTGVDTDAVAVETARANLELNGIPPAAYEIHTGSLTQGLTCQYTLVTANIITPVILQLLEVLGAPPLEQASPLIAPGGRLIVSGILSENGDQVADKMAQRGFTVLESREREGWTALAGALIGG